MPAARTLAVVGLLHQRAEAVPTGQADESQVALLSRGEAFVPQFILLGAQKAATTSVFDAIAGANLGVCGAKHPFNPNGIRKESHFFDLAEDKFPYETRWTKYRAQYVGGKGCAYYLDATPNYLFEGFGPVRMGQTAPALWVAAVRFLVIVREPIARDVSAFNHLKELWVSGEHVGETTQMGVVSKVLCEGASKGSFPTYATASNCKAVDWIRHCLGNFGGDLTKAYHYCAHYAGTASVHEIKNRTGFTVRAAGGAENNRLTNGMYEPQIRGYVRHFSRKQMLVLDFDRLVSREKTYLKKVAVFFGLPYSSHKERLQAMPKANTKEFAGKVSTISCKTRRKLHRVFTSYNTALFRYLAETRHEAPWEEDAIVEFNSQVPCNADGEMHLMLDSAGDFGETSPIDVSAADNEEEGWLAGVDEHCVIDPTRANSTALLHA